MKLINRSHNCGELVAKDKDKKVKLCGWINSHRDLGALIFMDLRDRWGITQVVFSEEENSKLYKIAKTLRNWDVVEIEGIVALRPDNMKNKDMATGEVEINGINVKLLNKTEPLPIGIEENSKVSEELRLKYRFLDLRRQKLQKNIKLRHKIALAVRNYLNKMDFLEIETPMLTKSTPEGARDYVVPSRVHQGNFYALPQSPQLFKQMLMVSGFDRYFQIVKCFRDEDLRADRQPEFTQIDIEMSFVTEEDIYSMVEGMMVDIGKAGEIDVKVPFDRITYKNAMLTYGSDKPDVRFGLKLIDVKEIVCDAGFKVFDSVKEAGGEIRAIGVENCATYSRKNIKELEDVAKSFGAKGLAYIKWTEEGLNSPILKFIGEEKAFKLFEALNIGKGDLILIVADNFDVTCNSLGAVRSHLGKALNLIPENSFEFIWVTDFPMFQWDEDANRYVAVHHPFTAPNPEYVKDLLGSAKEATARAYDIALNGYEIGGGSIRIHENEMQKNVFKAIGMTESEADDKFGFLLSAFKHGAPPHGGIAFGLDRIAMIFAGEESLREVIAFPKTTSATCLLTDSPSSISDLQKKELGIK